MQNGLSRARNLGFLCLGALPAVAQSPTWIRQFGTNSNDSATCIAPDGSGGAFLGGSTARSLGGPYAGGPGDAWLARYDNAGNRAWIRQFGTRGYDKAVVATPDGSGGVYVGGITGGGLGGPSAGSWDVWLARYDGAGNRKWIRQWGSKVWERAGAVAPDGSGGVYVGGSTEGNLGGPNAGEWDAWLARYDGAGNRIWVRQIGTSFGEFGTCVASDGYGGAYLGGFTLGSFGGPNAGGYDAWLARYDGAGNQLWIRQFGVSGSDLMWTGAPDGSGGLYFAGGTYGSFGGPHAGGFFDAWLARCDSAGNPTWVRQLGTSEWDFASVAAADGSGGVFVSGSTEGSLGGPSAGAVDAWLAHYDSAGNPTWTSQLGSGVGDVVQGVASDGHGGVYLVGETSGSLAGSNAGGLDAWFARYICGAAQNYCTSSATTHGCAPSIASTGIPSASAGSGFTISVANVEGQKLGLIFYGIDNTGWPPQPWDVGSSSYLCVKPPTQRMPTQNSGGTNGSCDGSLAIDWNAFRAANPSALGQPFAIGQNVFAQGWFRDPAAPKTTNLSNGLHFSVCP